MKGELDWVKADRCYGCKYAKRLDDSQIDGFKEFTMRNFLSLAQCDIRVSVRFTPEIFCLAEDKYFFFHSVCYLMLLIICSGNHRDLLFP